MAIEVTDSDNIPLWALKLAEQIAVLNDKLPTHIEWVERNVKDHETRLRNVEANRVDELPEALDDHEARIRAIEALHLGDVAPRIDSTVTRVSSLEAEQNRNAWLPRVGLGFTTAAIGALGTALVSTIITK